VGIYSSQQFLTSETCEKHFSKGTEREFVEEIKMHDLDDEPEFLKKVVVEMVIPHLLRHLETDGRFTIARLVSGLIGWKSSCRYQDWSPVDVRCNPAVHVRPSRVSVDLSSRIRLTCEFEF